MNLYLIRHSIAEDIRPGSADFSRQLTAEGVELMKRAAAGWKKYIPLFDHIVSSPLIRARQTAEIIKSVYEFEQEVLIDSAILADDVQSVFTLASSLGGKNTAFVGHQPNLSVFTAAMISRGVVYLDFKKAMLAKIHFEGKLRKECGTLEAVIPAKMF